MLLTLPRHPTPAQLVGYKRALCQIVFDCSLEEWESGMGRPCTWDDLRSEMERWAY